MNPKSVLYILMIAMLSMVMTACVDEDEDTDTVTVLTAGTGIMAGTDGGGSMVAGTEMGGSTIAGTEMGGSMVAGTEMGGSMVAGTEMMGGSMAAGMEMMGGSMVAGTEMMGGSMVAGTEMMGGSVGGTEMGGMEIGDPCEMRQIDPMTPCEVSMYAARNPMRVSIGRMVTIEGVVTTTRQGDEGTSHLVLQVSSASPEYRDPAYSAIWVYLNDATVELPDIFIGQNVRLTAEVGEYFGQRQLSVVSELIDLGQLYPPIMPIIIDATSVATNGALAEAYEGVLVSVSPVVVIEQNPLAGPGDRNPTQEFVIEGGLRVNDFLTSLSPLPAVGENWEMIVGILRFGNGDYKLEPRNSNDIGRPIPMGDPSGLKINEIDYSQPGADNGEFIEVINTGSQVAPLWGVYIDLINGTDLSSYDDYHLAEAADTLAPGELLVIGSAEVIMSLNVPTLGLGGAIQNGPDGVRLSHETSGVLDELAYGGLTLGEGGVNFSDEDNSDQINSLGRCNADSGENDNDFEVMVSTPGQMNRCP
jgi:hypothetical protein